MTDLNFEYLFLFLILSRPNFAERLTKWYIYLLMLYIEDDILDYFRMYVGSSSQLYFNLSTFMSTFFLDMAQDLAQFSHSCTSKWNIHRLLNMLDFKSKSSNVLLFRTLLMRLTVTNSWQFTIRRRMTTKSTTPSHSTRHVYTRRPWKLRWEILDANSKV